MNINDIKTIKKLGAGMFGTTYLVKYKNKKYAMKIQHILPKDTKKSYKNEMWRELDLYNYISKLKPYEQNFFVKLHKYEIIDNCTHIQNRPHKVIYNNAFSKRIKKLDKSKLCVKYFLDYLGNVTLDKYLYSHNISTNKKISFMLQIINIVLILHKGGYSHGDLHPGNIMVVKTKDKYFKFNGYKVPYYGYQLVAIDYGEVLNKKFGINYSKNPFTKLFVKNNNKHMTNEIFYSINYLLFPFSKMYNDCKALHKKLPWEKKGDIWSNGVKKLMNKHSDFFVKMIEIYGNLFPKCKNNLEYIYTNKNTKKSVDELMKNRKNTDDFWIVMMKLTDRFFYYYPKEYIKYFGWCKFRKIDFPKKYFIKINETTNYKQLIKIGIDILNL